MDHDTHAHIDIDSSAALALRALQALDEQAQLDDKHRKLLILAEDHLGELLGVGCSGEREGDGYYSHNGSTCPRHEWLVKKDYNAVHDALLEQSIRDRK